MDGREVDHRNRDGLDCRRINLRHASLSEQQCNKGPSVRNTSGIVGVFYDSKSKRPSWRARISAAGRNVFLGFFATKDEAAAARKQAEYDFYGWHAVAA